MRCVARHRICYTGGRSALIPVKLFGRKPQAETGARSGQLDGQDDPAKLSRRLTMSLTQAERLAAMLARSRASRVVEVADLLAGMYLSDWDHLAEYWEEDSQEKVENFLRRLCRISPPRWHSWIEFYDRERREGAQRQIWRLLQRLRKPPAGKRALKPSAALSAVLTRAELLAPHRDKVGDRTIPILTNECVLLCILRSDNSEISRKLAETGLDSFKLEREALFPRHEPLV